MNMYPLRYFNYCFLMREQRVTGDEAVEMRINALSKENQSLGQWLAATTKMVETQQEQINHLMASSSKKMAMLSQRLQYVELSIPGSTGSSSSNAASVRMTSIPLQRIHSLPVSRGVTALTAEPETDGGPMTGAGMQRPKLAAFSKSVHLQSTQKVGTPKNTMDGQSSGQSQSSRRHHETVKSYSADGPPQLKMDEISSRIEELVGDEASEMETFITAFNTGTRKSECGTDAVIEHLKECAERREYLDIYQMVAFRCHNRGHYTFSDYKALCKAVLAMFAQTIGVSVVLGYGLTLHFSVYISLCWPILNR